MKKSLLITLAAVALIALTGGFYLLRSYYLYLKQPLAPLTHAVPVNAVALIKSGSIAGFNEKARASGLAEVFDNQSTGTGFEFLASWADSLAASDDIIREFIEKREFLLCFTPDSSGNPQALVIVAAGKIRPALIQRHTTSLAAGFGATAVKEDHSPADLMHIRGRQQELWSFFYRGLWVIGFSKPTVLASLAAIDSDKNLSSDPVFLRLFESAGKKVDGIAIVQNKALMNFVQGPWNVAGSAAPENPRQWTAVDFSIRKDRLLLSGFTSTGTTGIPLNGQLPAAPDLDQNFIEKAALGFTIVLSDPAAYCRNFISDDTLHIPGYDPVNALETNEIFRLSDNLLSWAGNSVTFLADREFLNSRTQASMIVISSRNADSARAALAPFIKLTGENTGLLMASSLPERLWGPWFKVGNNLHIKIAGDFVAISPSLSMLQSYIPVKAEPGRIARTDAKYDPDLPDKGNLQIFINSDKWPVSSFNNRSSSWISFLSGCKQLAINYKSGDELWYTQGNLIFSDLPPKPPVRKEEPPASASGSTQEQLAENIEERKEKEVISTPESEKENKAGSVSIAATPVIVGGKTAGSRLIALITSGNMVETRDHNGDKVWSFRCEDKPAGIIAEADFYKNGQLNYLIFTNSGIHILNRDGIEIKDSPVILPGKPSGKPSLFDYDRKRDYRILYAGHDGLIHNTTIRGKALPDWQKPAKGNLAMQPEFFRTGSRDYLAFTGSDGKLLISDRRGRVRIPLPDFFRKSTRAPLFENRTNSKGLFLTLADDGRLAYITDKGVISYSSFGQFGKNPWFSYLDFDGDGSHDFIFSGKDKVVAFSRMKNVINQISIAGANFSDPYIYLSSSGENWLIVRDLNTNNIYYIHGKNQGRNSGKLESDTDPVIYNPGGRKEEAIVTTRKGKIRLTPLK